ncbi:phage tail tape measure protein [Nakamurella aerolata]|uniref:Phage tail tape measure protein n=1 Tax=Nakamurella aerolata TaxID=1656892 RepID=A0A849AAG1_9ACTN|nr:phage tail tape measure protein [Nakamurella aerolata]NNG36947.1 phage tail tape measure protein [Nakamurella aerolata]
MAQTAQRSSRSVQQMSRNTDSSGQSMAAMAKKAVAFVGVGAAIKSTVKAGADFQSSLNEMGAVSQATAQQMAQVSETARQLGNDVSLPGTSAATAAAAMTELAKGGFTAQQAMSAAKGTLQLAAAAQIDGAQAAEIQANALNTFGVSAADAGKVADILANTANAASGEITDFSQGLAQVGTPAKSLGISLQDTSAALGLFANNGIKGSDAGTSLKSMLVQLLSPSKQQAAALQELGVQAFDAQGNFVGLESLSGQLADASKRMTTEQYNAAAATAFGTDAVRAASVFAAEGAQGFDKMSTAVGRSGGAAELAQAKMKGLAGVGQIIQNAVQDAQLSLMDKLSPSLESAGKQLADLIPSAADRLVPALTDVATGAVSLAQGALPLLTSGVRILGPVLNAAGDAMSAVRVVLEPLVTVVGSAVGFFSDLPGPVQTAAIALGVAAVASRRLGTSIGTMATNLANGNGPLRTFGRQVQYLQSQQGMSGLSALAVTTGARIRSMSSGVTSVSGAMRSLSSGALSVGKGLMGAFGGPIGLAITGVTAAISYFSAKNAEAKQREEEHRAAVDELAGSFDRLTGSVNEAGAQMVTKSFADSAAAFKEIGLSAGDAAAAALEGGRAWIDYQAKIAGAAEKTGKIGAALENLSNQSVPAIRDLSSQLGLSETEIAKLAISGSASADKLVQAFIAMGDPPEYARQKVNQLRSDIENYVPAAAKARTESETLADAQRKTGDEFAATADRIGKAAGVTGSTVGAAIKTAEGSQRSLEAVMKDWGLSQAQQTAILKGYKDTLIEVNGQHYATQEAADAASASMSAAGASGQTAATGMDAAGNAAAGLTEDAAGAKEPTSALADAMKEIADQASFADTQTQYLQMTLDKMAGKDTAAETASRAAAAAMRDVGNAARDEADAKARVTEIEDKLNKLRSDGLAKDETRAQRTAAIAQTERDLANAKNSVKDAADRQADSLDKAATAAVQQTQAAMNAALANGNLAGAAKAGTDKMAAMRSEFIANAKAAGVPQKEAEKLADKYGLIPKNVKTAFQAETAQATANGQGLYRVYDPLQKKFTAQFLTAGQAQATTNAGNVVQKYNTAKGTWTGYLKANNDDANAKIDETKRQIDGLTGKKLKITYEGTLDPTFGSKSKMAAKATGGFMRGPGTGTSDDIPAWLSNGEFVMNANATKRFRPLLEHLNWNVAPAFASGGYLGTKGTDVKWDIGGLGLPPNFDSMTVAAGKAMAKAAGDALKSMLLLGGGAFAPGSGNWGPENMSGLAQNTAAAMAFIKSTFGINNIGGWRASGSVAASDHPKGKALDVMINGWSSPAGIQQGNKVAAYFTGNPSAYGTKYVIWRNQINKGGGWGPYIRSDGGNATDPTLAHMDHVHISFLSGPSGPMGGGGGAEPAGSGVERWRPLANRVAMAKGVPLYAVDHMMRQMNRESSGNPKAINLYDINARRGTPSKGLLQFIDPTFRRYADPGYNTNIWDPESQMRAFFNYVPSVYGSFEALQRRGYGAYASGGLVGGKGTGTSDSNVARVSRGEYIVNAKATSENLGLLHAINNGVARFATGGLVGRSALMGNSPRQLGDRESNIANAISDLLEFQKSFRAAANELISASNEAAKAAARHRGELRSQEASSKRAVYEARRAAAARVKEAEASSAAARRAVTAAERRKATARTGQQRAAATKALASAQTRAAQVERSLSIIRRQQASEVAKVVAAEQRKVASSRAEQAALDKTARRNASAAEAAKARAAAENRSIEVSRRWRSQLASAGRAMDNLNARLTATKDRLGDVKDQIKSTLADRSSAISQMAGQIGGTELTGNRDTRNTASRFLQGMRFDTGQLVQLNTDNAKLSRLGLNNSALQQLSQLGDGASVLHMLARTGSAGQIKAINAELAKQSRIATAVATRTIAPQFSGELAALTRGAAVTQQTLTALTREQLRTTQQIGTIADRMAKAAAMAGTVASKAELAQLERDLRKLVAQR